MEDILSAFFLVTNHTKLFSEKNKIGKLLTILLKIPMSNRVFCLWQFGRVEGKNEKQMKSKMGFPKYTTAKNSMIKFWNLSFESKECSLSIEVSSIKRLNMKMYTKINIISTSRHCSYFGHVDLIKHEAEVDPRHLLRHDLPNASRHLVALSWLFLLPIMSNMNALKSQLNMEF